MAGDEATAPDLLHHRAQVRMFTLADYVTDEASGKLYISGAGLEWAGVPVRPNPEMEGGQLFSCAVVLRLAFPRAIARDMHVIEILVRHADGSAAGPDPLFTVEMAFDLKRAPEGFTELSGNAPIQIREYPLRADPTDVIFLHLLVDDLLISRLPVEIFQAEE